MTIELIVPSVGESIQEVYIGEWLVAVGDYVQEDDEVVELESEKATVELPAPQGGVITKILKKPGEKATIGEVIGYIDETAAAPAEKPSGNSASTETEQEAPETGSAKSSEEPRIMPAARRLIEQHGLRIDDIPASGPGGRILKEDVERVIARKGSGSAATSTPTDSSSLEEIVPLSPMRRRIAERLVEAQQTAALLTTFNEIDMSEVIRRRAQYKAEFEKKHDVKLGFMSFFIKASIEALKRIPEVNAEIRGENVVYRNHYDIGIAVGGGKGLVVPVLRNADQLSFAETELAIRDFAIRAQKNRIKVEELMGGTFTISNGGVYGSLLSTPIVNPPQSGVLGMHAIQDRAVVVDGEIVVRPMMYVALTYDHRIIDGKEAVTFLKSIKELVEDPARLLLEI